MTLTFEVSKNGDYLTLTTGHQKSRFHAIWLRDNAWDKDSRSVENGQSLIALRDIPNDTYISAAALSGPTLRVSFAPEGKTIDYATSWLLDNAYDRHGYPPAGWIRSDAETWDSSLIDGLPLGDFNNLRADPAALRDWLAKINRFGFGQLRNGPVADQALMQVVDLFGYIHETTYGRYFEVRADVNPTNLAYTNLGLQAHTDNPYSETVPTIQIL